MCFIKECLILHHYIDWLGLPTTTTSHWNAALSPQHMEQKVKDTFFCSLVQNLLRQPAGPRVQLQYNLTVMAHSQHPIRRQPSSPTALNPLPLQCTIVSAVTFLLLMGYLTSPLLNIFTSMSRGAPCPAGPAGCCTHPPTVLGKSSREKTGNSLVFYQRGGSPPPL